MKKIVSLVLCVLMVFALMAGCSPNVDSGDGQTSVQTVEFPLTVTDQIGNEVTVDELPERIVSGYYISSSACIALGLEDKLVAVEEGTDQRPIYQLAAPELLETAGNVGSAKSFDLEACIAAEPDLVILPKKAQDYAQTLKEMGIPAIVVSPESHEELVQMIELIGTLTDTVDRADTLVAKYEELLGKVENITADISDEEKPYVYICGTNSYMTTAPKDMYQSSLIAASGGKNAAENIDGDSWTDVSYEQFLSMNPDVIIIPSNNMANGQPDYSADDISADPQLSEIKAVKDEKIYNMPYGFEAWDSPVPSGVLGTLWITAVLYPDEYSMEDFAKDAADFYQEFYDFEMDTSAIV